MSTVSVEKQNQSAGLKAHKAVSKPAVRKPVTDQPQSAQSDLQSALAAPESATPEQVQAMQQQAGNQAVMAWLNQPPPGADLGEAFSGAVQSAHGSGLALPGILREQMEGSLQADFGAVRLHVDDQADALNQQIGARAFTVGADIFFQRGGYSPYSPEGQRTLRHELAHVVQQGQGGKMGRLSPRVGGNRLRLGAENDAHEQEARRVSQPAAQGEELPQAAGAAPAGSVQRIANPFKRLYNRLRGRRQQQPDPTLDEVLSVASTTARQRNAALAASRYVPEPGSGPEPQRYTVERPMYEGPQYTQESWMPQGQHARMGQTPQLVNQVEEPTQTVSYHYNAPQLVSRPEEPTQTVKYLDSAGNELPAPQRYTREMPMHEGPQYTQVSQMPQGQRARLVNSPSSGTAQLVNQKEEPTQTVKYLDSAGNELPSPQRYTVERPMHEGPQYTQESQMPQGQHARMIHTPQLINQVEEEPEQVVRISRR